MRATAKYKKVNGTAQCVFLFILLLPFTSLLSISGLACIALSKTHQEKFKNIQKTAYQAPTKPILLPTYPNEKPIEKKKEAIKGAPSQKSNPLPQKTEPVEKHVEFLNEISSSRKNMYYQLNADYWGEKFNRLTAEFSPGIMAHGAPDYAPLSNIMKECLEDNEAFFLSSSSLQTTSFYNNICLDIRNPEQLSFLIKTLCAAFESGKKIVVARLANDIHVLVAGFTADGNFKLIDSMSNHTVSLSNLSKALNDSSIKNSLGLPIHFKGEYLNTHIQKGGHECGRFATLYCYHMFKRKDLNAYQEVNGAFSEGKFKTFEDYKNIDGSKKIRSLAGQGKEIYERFMRSWAFRIEGLTVDNWQDFTIEDFIQNQQIYDGVLNFYSLTNSPDIFPKKHPRAPRLIIANPDGTQLSISDCSHLPSEQKIPFPSMNSTLGSLFTSNDGSSRLYMMFDKNHPSSPQIFRLLPGQQLYEIDSWGVQTNVTKEMR